MTTGSLATRPPPTPAEELALEADEVHVWYADLDAPAWPLRTLSRSLAPSEWGRADRLRSAEHRQRFLAGRGMLRQLLAAYLGARPAALELGSGTGGKPEVAAPLGNPAVRFNCSHSQSRAVYALTLERQIGVDVEVVRPVPEAVGIAERWFSARERRQLVAAPPGLRAETFLRSWTAKEAYLKALGDGLASDASRTDGSALPPAWWRSPLRPATDCVGAVVAEDRSALRLRLWSLEAPSGSSSGGDDDPGRAEYGSVGTAAREGPTGGAAVPTPLVGAGWSSARTAT